MKIADGNPNPALSLLELDARAGTLVSSMLCDLCY